MSPSSVCPQDGSAALHGNLPGMPDDRHPTGWRGSIKGKSPRGARAVTGVKSRRSQKCFFSSDRHAVEANVIRPSNVCPLVICSSGARQLTPEGGVRTSGSEGHPRPAPVPGAENFSTARNFRPKSRVGGKNAPPLVPRGRPSFAPTQNQRRKVEDLAAAGVSIQRIAHVIGIDRGTVAQRFAIEIAVGRDLLRAEVVELLFRSARAGKVGAMIRLLDVFDRTAMDRPPLTRVNVG